MNTYTTYLTSVSSSSVNSNVYLDLSTLKGGGIVTFDLTGIDQSTIKIKKLYMNYGDFSEVKHYFRGIVSDNIPTIFTHTYLPTPYAYFLSLSAVITAFYDNDVILNFVVPFRLAQSSLYDDADNIFINASQLLPNSFTTINFTGNNTQYTFIGVLSN